MRQRHRSHCRHPCRAAWPVRCDSCDASGIEDPLHPAKAGQGVAVGTAPDSANAEMIDGVCQHAAVGMRRLQRRHRVAARPKPRHRQDSLVPEDKDEPVMRCQHVAKTCRLMRAPAHRQHQHHHDESDNPAQAEQSDLGSYQSLQHDVPVLREPWVPTC